MCNGRRSGLVKTLVVERLSFKVNTMVKKLLSILSFAVMTILSYKTVRTFSDVTAVFSILAILTMLSAFMVGKTGKLVEFLFEDTGKDHRCKGNKLSLTGLSLYVIFLFGVSYGIVFVPTIIAIICVGSLILLGMVCVFY